MNHLIFISGPPCSGKSTVCNGLLECSPSLVHVAGDTFWMKNGGVPFKERVALTNAMILDFLEMMTDSHVLLEWVPSLNPFRDQVKRVCDTTNRLLTHIVLFAPISVLKERKVARDGDYDIGHPDIERFSSIHDAVVINTAQHSQADVVNALHECITAPICHKTLK